MTKLREILSKHGIDPDDDDAPRLAVENLSCYYELFNFYWYDIPYGTKKARTGDPYEWIHNRLERDLADKRTGGVA